jgi:membrane-bound lytic murein transglycosylase D
MKEKGITMKYRIFLVTFVGLMLATPAGGASVEKDVRSSLVSLLKLSGPLDFCGEEVPIEVPDVRERFEKAFLLTLWNRPQVILWLKRSRRYMPDIEKILDEKGLPNDLKYISVAESALRPHAGSGKGAVGFWQFNKPTGEKYGLIINSRRDERRNIFASTAAASRYLSHLHETFGSWTLSAAAYNMGEDGLMAEVLEQGTQNYYDLYLPLETQLFIFRILSIKLIFSDPQKYGFQLSDEDYYSPQEFDAIRVDCIQETPIRVIAEAAKTHFKVIKDLNPEIRGHYLAAGNHDILIPRGASADFQVRYREIMNRFVAAQKDRTYIVQEGDNLSSIAERFGIPLTTLIIWNRIDINRPLHPGDRLIVYRGDTDSGEKERDTEQ